MTIELSAQHPVLATDIRISIISDHEWRVCDRRVPESNGESVLGYIDKTGEYFEVLKLAATRTLLYFTDFDRAVACFSGDVAPDAVATMA